MPLRASWLGMSIWFMAQRGGWWGMSSLLGVKRCILDCGGGNAGAWAGLQSAGEEGDEGDGDADEEADDGAVEADVLQVVGDFRFDLGDEVVVGQL